MLNNECPCKKTGCSRHGNCAECMAHHAEKRLPPYCKRAEEKAERAARRQEKRQERRSRR